MASNGIEAEPKKLSDLFDSAWKKFQEIDVCDLPSVSEKYQVNCLFHCITPTPPKMQTCVKGINEFVCSFAVICKVLVYR